MARSNVSLFFDPDNPANADPDDLFARFYAAATFKSPPAHSGMVFFGAIWLIVC